MTTGIAPLGRADVNWYEAQAIKQEWSGPTPEEERCPAPFHGRVMGYSPPVDIFEGAANALVLQAYRSGFLDAMNSPIVKKLYAAAQEGRDATRQTMSEHECHNDDCSDAIRCKFIAEALCDFEVGLAK